MIGRLRISPERGRTFRIGCVDQVVVLLQTLSKLDADSVIIRVLIYLNENSNEFLGHLWRVVD